MSTKVDEAHTDLLTASSEGIVTAGALLRAGKLVAFPTETVYGLGADATNGNAVAAIYAAKERPSFNPLIAHYPDTESAMRHGRFNEAAAKLAHAFWPGPLTLVVPKADKCPISELASAGLDSVALRVPQHPIARAVLQEAGIPVAAPSANRSGRVSPTTASHVMGDLDGRIAAILDGGDTHVGVESTIVACILERPILLRPGGITREALKDVLGFDVEAEEFDNHPGDSAPIAPGQLSSHYAPNAKVRLNASSVLPDEAALSFGAPLPGADIARAHFNLSAGGNLEEAAAQLFSALRQLDITGVDCIAVAPIPLSGLGEAINDRLFRAAAPRP